MKNLKTDPDLIVCGSCGAVRESMAHAVTPDTCESCGTKLPSLFQIFVR